MHADLIADLHFDHRTTFSGAVAQVLQCLKIILLHIGIHRADHDGFILCNALYILQISRCQRNCQKSISTPGFYVDSNLLSQLTIYR